MNRAAILIGVNKTGDLPELQAARSGAERMQRWALAQGIPLDQAILITDAEKPVDLAQIQRAVMLLVDKGTVEQLLIYFAGHGVNVRYGEYWLLSEAPRVTTAAVNLRGSVDLARDSKIPHVVFISDACRTAADTIRAQGVTGGEIFPNDYQGDRERFVDQFFASRVGSPALEVKSVDDAMKGFSEAQAFDSIYSKHLIDALNGNMPDALESTNTDGANKWLIRPRKLRDALEKKVMRDAAGKSEYQQPSAIITSDPDAWLSIVAPPLPPSPASPASAAPAPAPAPSLQAPPSPVPITNRGRGNTIREPVHTQTDAQPNTLEQRANKQLDAELAPENSTAQNAYRSRGPNRGLRSTAARDPLDTELTTLSSPFGPGHYETACGFKVKGAVIKQVTSPVANIELLGDTLVRVHPPAGPACRVLLEFTDGNGVVLPAFRDHLCSLVFVEGELHSVCYEPSDTSSRWSLFQPISEKLQRLRAIAITQARMGVFQLQEVQVNQLLAHTSTSSGVDLTVALLVAYALHEQGQRIAIAPIANSVASNLQAQVFDLSLLTGKLRSSTIDPMLALPGFPLIARGWGLLSARSVPLPDELKNIEEHLVPCLWTVFNKEGVIRVRNLLEREGI